LTTPTFPGGPRGPFLEREEGEVAVDADNQ
jgi:hypothetical protein